MIELKHFGNGSSQYHGKLEDLLNEAWYKNLQLILDHFKEGYTCHVRILDGDYKGSIAKFKLAKDFMPRATVTPFRVYCKEECYNYQYYFQGKLSWKGKRNNPKFSILNSTCDVLLNYTGEEVFQKYDAKKVREELLQQEVKDINGNVLSVGDKVLYINSRYGSGAALSHGTVAKFKALGRDNTVSVIVTNDCIEEESECRYPEQQISLK